MNKKALCLSVAMILTPISYGVLAGDASVMAGDTGATMYEKTDYQGAHKFFPEKEGKYTLTGNENDFYHSVKVGRLSKVFAWQHGGTSNAGGYQEWTHDDSDFTDLGGLSNFKVVPNTQDGIAVRFIDTTGSAKKYCMSSKVWSAGGAADVNSCSDNPTYQLVGTLDSTLGGESIVASVRVRNMQQGDSAFGQYINNGSVYFKSNGNGDIFISHDNGEFDNFPANMEVEEVSPNRFDFYLTSETPDTK